MNYLDLLMAMIFAHFLADWTLQTRLVAENKSKYAYIMLVHSFVWTFCLYVPLLIAGYHIYPPLFLTMILLHCWVDEWKCNKVWKKKDDKGKELPFNADNFQPWHLYVDQGIHFLQVVALWAIYIST